MSEYDFQTYDHNGQVVSVDKTRYAPPWWARWLSHLRDAIDEKGGDINAATHLHSWVSRNPAFEGVVYREYFLWIVPPPRGPLEAEIFRSIDASMRENALVN